ncbi:MAG: HDIG domain-containing protein [Tepidibacter sp.]|jgi:putative nucleotidyltransferase with HDIG domain|uniref:HD family phosphohydrolase n=1 Tax=Tepidibacter sp. TaxID=2529387 RepID=UPI0025FA0024|nr:HDIG domain-containing metalloprotein [Tepidibacter sp.]MCT4508070.1 HDIG domain-containing protein [Tepidibacter sp.]
MKFKKFSLALLFFIINFIVLFAFLAPQKYELRIGQRAQEDIKATKDIENKIETQKLIDKAVQQVQPVFKINPTVQAEIKSDIEKFFSDINEINKPATTDVNNGEQLDSKQKLEIIQKKYPAISNKSINLALNMEKVRLEKLKNYIFEIINQIMSTGITKEEVDYQKKNVSEFFEEIKTFNQNEKLLSIEIIDSYIRPNKFLDLEKTQEKTEQAKTSVEKIVIPKGQNIISKGEVITKEKLELLQSIGLVQKKGKEDFFVIIGLILIIIILEVLGVLYINVFDKKILKNEKKLLLIILIISITMLISISLSKISLYIIPVAGASMLISILLNTNIAIISNLIISIMLYIATGDINILLISLVSGTFGSFANLEIAQRRNVIITGFKIGILNLLLVMSLGFITTTSLKEPFINSLLSLLSGIISSIFVVGSLPLWEHYFDILTSLKLLELSSPNNEILKRMLIETPGTYHHSIIVGNLAERACDNIGANSLFARVASYYHDMGKLSKPYFFKENQITNDNPHDKMSPIMSVKIIKEHVSYGVELAQKYKLPKEIINIIREHHGTTSVAYFYYKAKEMGMDVKEEDFRYKGPEPQSKEAAVIMMADSVEAAIRSIKEPSKEKIEDMIEKIVKGKLNDGQFNKSNLTLKELDLIKRAFIEVIMGMFHERIEYPEEGGN